MTVPYQCRISIQNVVALLVWRHIVQVIELKPLNRGSVAGRGHATGIITKSQLSSRGLGPKGRALVETGSDLSVVDPCSGRAISNPGKGTVLKSLFCCVVLESDVPFPLHIWHLVWFRFKFPLCWEITPISMPSISSLHNASITRCCSKIELLLRHSTRRSYRS